MEKYNKYRSIIFTLSTAMIFGIWSQLQSLLVTYSKEKIIWGFLLGTVVSLGSYRLVLKIIEYLVINCKFVKKKIFGRSYMDGIWVGAYMGGDGKLRYIIEYFEQDFNSFVIRGTCYYENKKYKGEWKSNNVSIDEEKGEISYTYDTLMIEGNLKAIGFAVFTFGRQENASYKTIWLFL